MTTVTLRYWAGLRAAAGLEQEEFQADTAAQALDQARSRHDAEFARVLGICSFLLDGRRLGPQELGLPLADLGGAEPLLEALPPFAGG